MLSAGATLGPYEVVSPLGAGGMGEVYLARDTKLDRDVALKVLPEAFTSDPDRSARFEREAKVLASLNHTHIGHIYGVEEADGVKALVLELVEGPTLADRIAQGPIPLDEALPIAKQIAEALEAAHEQGIVHRDLKPANVKVRPDGTVKVLDFGLAKALEGGTGPGGSSANLSQSPTLAHSATQAGVILGTAAYMAPEQARGRPVDKRADIWAFGAVLFEMLTGQRAFVGGDVTDTLASVLRSEPEWTALSPRTPPGLVRALERCLRKDPERRFRDIGDVRLEIEEVGSPPAAGTADSDAERAVPARRLLPWGLAATMALLAAAGGFQLGGRQAPSATRAHLQIVLPEGLRLATDMAHPTLALSPDGSRLAFVANDGRTRRLYVRDLAASTARVVAGTEGAASPFFSPDGAWIGFLAGMNLMKVPSVSGAPVAVHTTTPAGVNRGATWVTDESVIVAASVNTGLQLGSVDGEKQRSIVDWEALTDMTAPFSWPDALPNGRSVLFTDSREDGLEAARVAVLSLESGAVTPLGRGGTNPRYSPTGHVLYGRGGSLYGVRFDVDQGLTSGAEVELLKGVMGDGNGSMQYAVGGDGALAYVSGPLVAEYELVWIDREGRAETLLESERPMFAPRLSPDASRLAVTVVDGSNLDLWLFDLARRTLTRRLTTDPGEDFGPVWHPQGRQLALSSETDGDGENPGPGMALMRQLDASPEPLTRTLGWGNWEFPSSWSPDGEWLAFVAKRAGDRGDILLVSPPDWKKSKPFLQTGASEQGPMFSPDGRWLAYVSDDTGRRQVYVRPFPGPGDRTPVSSDGGTGPLWARDGRELFYRQGDRIMVARVDGSGESFAADEPELLLRGVRLERWSAFGSSSANYDVSPDGRRFVMARRKNAVTATVVNVVLNWPQTLLGSSEAKR